LNAVDIPTWLQPRRRMNRWHPHLHNNSSDNKLQVRQMLVELKQYKPSSRKKGTFFAVEWISFNAMLSNFSDCTTDVRAEYFQRILKSRLASIQTLSGLSQAAAGEGISTYDSDFSIKSMSVVSWAIVWWKPERLLALPPFIQLLSCAGQSQKHCTARITGLFILPNRDSMNRMDRRLLHIGHCLWWARSVTPFTVGAIGHA
jgi:hypothetical protein